MIKWSCRVFLHQWERKLISFFLAVIVWLFVNNSMTTTKNIENISVRLINIPLDMTVEGILSNGLLSKKISLCVQGNKSQLSRITSNDLEVILDAEDKSGEWLAPVSIKTVMFLNPNIDFSTVIKRVFPQHIPIHFSRVIKEKIPLIITQPIGETPEGYRFAGVWPYRLSITLSGAEKVIKALKAKGITLTFNLNDIPRSALESQENQHACQDEISYFVPPEWKTLEIPSLSDCSFTIDDPRADELRIDFIRDDLMPIGKPIPINLHFFPKYSSLLNPISYSLAVGKSIRRTDGLYFLDKPLYVKGVSKLFLDLVQDMLEISIFVLPKTERNHLDWSIQLLNPRLLEDRYVSIFISDDRETPHPYSSLKKKRGVSA